MSRSDGWTQLCWWVGLLLIPVVWQLYALSAESPLIVGPVEVAQAAVVMIVDGTLVTAAGESATVFVTGMAAGTLLGLVIGILVGRFRVIDVMLDPYISALFAT
ncbi:MAG: hypothetical protein GEU96_13245, partial [Propionibacteriales bacterium]|nr:hypothetical protein [Propionibacteriales bacterium]